MSIFVCGITAEFETTEELLSLQAMHGTTKGEDLFEQVVFVSMSCGISVIRSATVLRDKLAILLQLIIVFAGLEIVPVNHPFPGFLTWM